jgi:hypothetical protein
MSACKPIILFFWALLSAGTIFSQDGPLAFQLSLNQFDPDQHNLAIHRFAHPLDIGNPQTIEVLNSRWLVSSSWHPIASAKGVQELRVKLICEEGSVPQAAWSLEMKEDDWSTDNYLLLPAAAYNGNRYDYRRIRYSPKLLDPRDIGVDVPPILSDIPKLSKGPGPSRMQLRSGDLSVPSIGYWMPESESGIWILFDVGNEQGDYGLTVAENKSRDKITFSLSSPVVREQYKYRITNNRWPSDDQPAHFQPGDSLSFQVRVHQFEAAKLQSLFDEFASIRKSMTTQKAHRLVIPFSDAFSVQEQKFNELNWEDTHGYYSVGPRNMFLQDWQIGWTGGMISTFPLLWQGDSLTRLRVIRNFQWLFPDGLAPSGLFWDSGEGGDKWYGGDIRKPHTANWHLIRKSGDGLFYLIKQLMLMDSLDIAIEEEWKHGVKGCADALAKIWRTTGQFGQFVDNRTGEVMVGGSTSGGIIPGALALSSAYFGDQSYLEVAEASAAYYYENFVQKGISMGGPGDALQNFDSESCYGLLASFASLFEVTGDSTYLKMGSDVARQFSTWVIAYDYDFPDSSLFGKEGMHSLGAVFANTQNKHGAPGICTHSGVALLQLYRATGDPFYVELLQDIARNMPQYLPHPQQPIEGAKVGWMCERVNTTDWLEGIGEVSYLTTWSETALMLTYVEVPGLYVRPDQGDFVVFDNISAEISKDTRRYLELKLHNPTQMAAAVKVLAENASQREKALGPLGLWGCQKVNLAAGESKTVRFSKR